jgi:hypothetical protein
VGEDSAQTTVNDIKQLKLILKQWEQQRITHSECELRSSRAQVAKVEQALATLVATQAQTTAEAVQVVTFMRDAAERALHELREQRSASGVLTDEAQDEDQGLPDLRTRILPAGSISTPPQRQHEQWRSVEASPWEQAANRFSPGNGRRQKLWQQTNKVKTAMAPVGLARRSISCNRHTWTSENYAQLDQFQMEVRCLERLQDENSDMIDIVFETQYASVKRFEAETLAQQVSRSELSWRNDQWFTEQSQERGGGVSRGSLLLGWKWRRSEAARMKAVEDAEVARMKAVKDAEVAQIKADEDAEMARQLAAELVKTKAAEAFRTLIIDKVMPIGVCITSPLTILLAWYCSENGWSIIFNVSCQSLAKIVGHFPVVRISWLVSKPYDNAYVDSIHAQHDIACC